MTDKSAPLWALSTADPDVCGECAGVIGPAEPPDPRPSEKPEAPPPAPPLPEPL
jgi:hypothetical protein